MTEREALKLALEALENVYGKGKRCEAAIAAIKQVLAQPEQEPVAWRWGVPKLKNGDFEWRYSLNQTRPDAIPLYTTPPQPEQEPVAITITGKLGNIYSFTGDYSLKKGDKVYTTPPQRKPWAALTEQEHTDIAVECGCMSSDWVFYGATVERLLKEKNS